MTLRTLSGPARDTLLASLARRPATISPAECEARNAAAIAERDRAIAEMRQYPERWAGTRPRPVTDEQWDYDMQRHGLWAV